MCSGPCPTKQFGTKSYDGTCTEYEPKDCRCVYVVDKGDLEIKVLVTGFADFDEPNEPHEVESNPAGRLLTGNATSDFRNDALDGPLVTFLNNNAQTDCGITIKYEFKVLPVEWEAAKDNIDYCEYDFVISLGLGADDAGELDLEQDAANSRAGNDVNGDPPPAPTIDPNQGANGTIQGDATVRDRVTGQDGNQDGNFTVDIENPRPQNCYICNETHAHGLMTLNEEQSKCEADCLLDGVFFIHIPDQAADAALAAAIGGLIGDLVEPL